MKSEYYDRAGNPITEDEWIVIWKNNKVVEKTKIGAECEVSTVYLGLDHGWDDGPPMIFETLVFGGPLDQEMTRYSSEEDAIAGHASICESVRQTYRATSGV